MDSRSEGFNGEPFSHGEPFSQSQGGYLAQQLGQIRPDLHHSLLGNFHPAMQQSGFQVCAAGGQLMVLPRSGSY